MSIRSRPYEKAEDDYVVLEDEGLGAVKLELTGGGMLARADAHQLGMLTR